MNTAWKALLPLAFLALAAFEKDGPMEEAGEDIDNVVEDVRDEAEDAMDRVEESVEEAAEKVDDTQA